MKKDQDIIYTECMKPEGFASLIRENRVDENRFENLLGAIERLTEATKDEKHLDKLMVACLFELPWEVENTVEHYKTKDEELGAKVETMSEKLREAINELLWTGLEEYYENL